MKALIDIPQTDLLQLDKIAKHLHTSRTQLVRQAIGMWLVAQKKISYKKDDAFGILKKSPLENTLKIQRKLRQEWE